MTPDDYPEYCNVTPLTTAPQQPPNKGELEYGTVAPNGDWRLRRFDDGMGESEYRIFRNEKFFAMFDNRKDADTVMELMTIGQPPAHADAVLDNERIGMNSTDILLLANDEWKRREQRKHRHDVIPWVAGFINGFLTDKKWAREYIAALRQRQGTAGAAGDERKC